MGPGQQSGLVRAVVGMALATTVAGCATQADLDNQARKLQGMIAQQSRSIEGLKDDVERLRADLAGRTRAKSGETPRARPRATDGATEKDRVNALGKRPRQPALSPPSSGQIGETLSPEGESTEEPGH